ncbi:MAG: acetyl-CoA C-acyltransferase [Rhizobacter sp.]|nr:acetyl-CoA C-acyltransferase [Chlorobiales bacterium]
MPEAFIAEYIRTPIGKYGGALRDTRPDDLAALAMRRLLDKTKLDGILIDDVIFGCANGAGEDNRNIAHMASLLAGLPESVPGVTVNRLCGSSMDAVIAAKRAILSGDAQCILAGGVESMTRAPYSVPKNASGSVLFGNLTMYDTALGWRYPNPKMEALFPLESMGETAENVAEQFHIERLHQDEFALESHHKAILGFESGILQEEIVPAELPQKKPPTSKTDSIFFSMDETPRKDTTLERLSALQPAFRKGGTVTAGNSSSLNDGACALIIASKKFCEDHALKPVAKIIASAAAGVSPRVMGIGPVPASRKALQQSGLSVRDMDLIELNEAFAAQSLAVIRELGLDAKKVNPNGGAIAFGHPLGMSGGRLLGTLAFELRRKNLKYGLATMCIGVGQGLAVVIENVS